MQRQTLGLDKHAALGLVSRQRSNMATYTRISPSLVAPAFLALLALVSCRITDNDVEQWKGTVKGPGRLIAVVLSDRYPETLRLRAGLALVELERQDVDGVAELYRAIKHLHGHQQAAFIEALLPGLEERMGITPTGAANSGGDTSFTPLQTRAKDLAYLLTPLVAGATQQRLTQAVMNWYLIDLNGRSLAGNYTAEQVVRSLGPVAAAPMVRAISPRLPSASLVRIAKLIRDVGDQDTKAKAAQRLVDVEREMESKGFVDWLAAELRKQYAAQGQKKVDAKKLQEAAELNRDNFISTGAIPALKPFATFPVVAERLIEIAVARPSAAQSVERRVQALQALETNVQESQVTTLLNLALDPQAPREVRDLAFDRVGETHNKVAVPRLWPLLQQTSDPKLRWRAGELILTLGGANQLDEFLAKLPPAPKGDYSPAELEGYATRISQIGPPPLSKMSGALRSDDWGHRVIALRFFERRGSAEHIEALLRSTKDGTPVSGSGWPTGSTVGKVAEDAIANLKARLSQQSGSEGGPSAVPPGGVQQSGSGAAKPAK